MTQAVEHFVYAHGDGPITLQVSENGSTYYDMTLTATLAFSDALQEWEDQANAHGTLTGTYTFSVETDGRVRLACSTTAYYKGPQNLWKLLGFTGETLGNGTQVDSDYTNTPTLGRLAMGAGSSSSMDGFSGCGYSLVAHSEDLKVQGFRLGRSMALAHSHAQVVEWWVVMERALFDAYTVGPLFRGKMRLIHSAETAGYDADNLTNAIDLFPYGKVKVADWGRTGSYVRVSGRGTITTDADPAVPTAGTFEELARGWSYGWGVIYGATIEGIGADDSSKTYMFTEVPTGASDPLLRWEQCSGLIVDASAKIGAMVNRREGLGAGFDLTLSFADAGTGGTNPLRQSGADAAIIRALFKAPGAATRLTADLDSSGMTVTVEDTSAFGSAGNIHIGKESLKYSAKTATTFTVSARGVPLEYFGVYNHSAASSVGTYVTDTPQIWRGRQVALWAIPVDPFGEVTGTYVDSDAHMIWRGFVADQPRRVAGVWQVPCKPYDRRLAEPLGGSISGQAKWDFEVDYLIKVDAEAAYQADMYTVDSWGTDQPTINFVPFSSYTTGDEITVTQWREAFADALETALGSLGWSTTYQPTVEGVTWVKVAHPNGGFAYSLEVLASAGEAGQRVGCMVMQVGGWSDVPSGLEVPGYADWWIPLHGFVCDSTSDVNRFPLNIMWSGKAARYLLQFAPDDGNTADIPSSGFVILEADGASSVHRYSDATIDDSGQGTALVTLWLEPGEQPGIEFLQIDDEGASGITAAVSVRIAYRDTGLAVDVLRRMLASSGRTNDLNDPTYDTGDARQGYDLERVDHTQIGEVLSPVWDALSMDLLADTDTGFAAVFGPILALCNHALVTKDTGSIQEIQAVNVGLADTGYYVSTITDDDLVSSGREAPVKVLRNAHPRPNRVRLTVEHTTNNDDWSITVNDIQSQRQHGAQSWDLTARGFSRDDLGDRAVGWCSRLLGAGLARPQVVELQVHPGQVCAPGDLVRLDLTHYDLWSYATGTPGYSGPGRVIGTQLNLSTGVKTVRLLIDGVHRTMALCPSEQITAVGAGTPPAYVEIRQEAYNQFRQWLDRDGSYDVQAYLPGSDTHANRWTISAVTDTGSACRLTISAETGTFTASTSWFVTVPETAQATAAQLEHAHTDTAGIWA